MGVAYDNATFSDLAGFFAVDKRPGGLPRALDFESVRLKDQEKRALVDCLLAGCSYRVPERFVMENSPCRLKKEIAGSACRLQLLHYPPSARLPAATRLHHLCVH